MIDFEEFEFTENEWETCLKVLEILKNDPLHNPDNQKFSGIITKLRKNARKAINKEENEARKNADLKTLYASVIADNARNGKSDFSRKDYTQQEYKRLNAPKSCYCCNQLYWDVHFFYHRMCPECAEKNYEWRYKDVDLKGRFVILTGGRVKVGFATALRLLRSGANVMITTRFPALALEQYQKETDFKNWKDRLYLYGLDLRNLNAVMEFIAYYKKHFPHLDILINNAAQTIKYPLSYYQPLLEKEQKLLENKKPELPIVQNHTPIEQEERKFLPSSKLDDMTLSRFGQPVDARSKNSWNSTLEEIDPCELLEVNLINQISPYLLLKELIPQMKKSPFQERFIINVTSSEGQFSYTNKTIYHPHTNMTKAALNMMTKTSARELVRHQIYMNAVDVGWISTGAIENLRKKQFEKGYIPPLDSVDGAARITHPLFEIINNKVIFAGELLKNYSKENW